jgi:GTP-binding protein Era
VGQADLLQSGMRETALTALKESDVILYLAAPDVRDSASLPPELLACLEKTVLLLNKVDAFKKGVWREFRSCLQTRASFRQVVEVSARTRFGLEELEQVLQPLLPEGPPLYQEDEITDQTPRQSAAEVIREKALFFVQEEVPHGLAVEIEEYQERPDGIHAIRATLYVERESQKGIVIGKSGEMLKKIGTAARLEMEKMFGARIFLTLWVKAVKNWKKDEAFLKRLGYPVGKMRREK